jgi:uncharacterized protein (TIGR02147 family)
MANTQNIFEFSDYRKYLSVWLKHAKQTKSSTLTKLAEVAGVHPTFLSHVLTGNKHLSLEQAALISEYMAHTKLEQDYFVIIINLDRAGNEKLRRYWQEKKSQLETQKNKLSERFEKHRQLSSEERAEFYSSWLYVATWVSTSINDKQSVSQIAERFHITREKAQEVLHFLTKTGLCKEKDGMFSMNEDHVHVPNESLYVVKHHINWRMKSIQKMDARTEKELFFTGPMSIAAKDFDVIREKLAKLIKDVVDIAKKSDAEEVVCLNIDFFK